MKKRKVVIRYKKKHAYWAGNKSAYDVFCSHCKKRPLWDDEEYYNLAFSKYCPHCGARMDLKNETKNFI